MTDHFRAVSSVLSEAVSVTCDIVCKSLISVVILHYNIILQVLREREAETQQHSSDQTASEVPAKPL